MRGNNLGEWTGLIASWDGDSLSMGGLGEGQQLQRMHLDAEAPDGIPDVDAAEVNVPVEVLLWPVERLLLRPFSLPLNNPKLLDADILAQELAEQSGAENGDWWLAWQAQQHGSAVSGIVFGMHRSIKALLAEHELWGRCRYIGPDVCVRLHALLPNAPVEACAIIDADSQGMFVGVQKDGIWRGMRRVNLVEGRSLEDTAEDVLRSLRAMGHEPGSQPAYGQLDEALAGLLTSKLPCWQGALADKLPNRHEANLAAVSQVQGSLGPNFRHDSWAVSGEWQSRLRPWWRAALLAASLLLLMLGGNLYRVYHLQMEQANLQAGVEAAFHRGLPDEKVMLDPLAQMRKAAGGGRVSDAWFFLRQLQAVGQLKKKVKGLHIASMQYTGKDMQLSGTVPDLVSVNHVRSILSSILGHQVNVEDTELADKQVRFRIKWS